MAMRAMALRRALHGSATARALPALADEAPKSGGLLSSLFGGSAPPTLPPLTEPLPGVAVPPYTAPTKAPATTQKKLANGLIIAAEETPVRVRWRQALTPAGAVGAVAAGAACTPGAARSVRLTRASRAHGLTHARNNALSRGLP